MLNIDTRLISSCEKIFPDDMPSKYSKIEKTSALLGERISVQLAYRLDPNGAAIALCSEMYGKDAVVSAIEEELGTELDLRASARSADTIHRVRERVNSMIKAKLS